MKLLALCFFAWGTGTIAYAMDPELLIQFPGQQITVTRSQLLARADVEQVQIDDDAAYGKRMNYRAIKIAALLKQGKIAGDASVEFVASDGFASSIRFEQLRNATAGKSVAYLAIEESGKPWPALDDGKSAGPYYLVWKDPAAGGIAKEQWPYAIARIEVRASLERLYPATRPTADASAAVKLGYQVYIKNCLPCHPLNNAGPSRRASDLNLPQSSTEVLDGNALRESIRVPPSGMPSFPKDALSDADLDRLIEYLEHMANHKVAITRQ
jgi:mono/diheme cytochrome c family protein